MWTNRFLIVALLGFGGLLMGANSARAQGYGYVYGYYYPDSQRFVTFQERPHFQFNVSPERMEAFTHQRLYGTAATQSYAYPPVPAASSKASIEVMLPDAQARLWFDGARTNATGVHRLFQSPSLTSGLTYTYRLKASWMKDGREVTRERTISVSPGQATIVDFAR